MLDLSELHISVLITIGYHVNQSPENAAPAMFHSGLNSRPKKVKAGSTDYFNAGGISEYDWTHIRQIKRSDAAARKWREQHFT